MRFSQPLVLLLGSVLSASGIGCSAISAVVSDSRPQNRENRGDADRLAAIGRVFENQGRYDKAEVMYRKALKSHPQDSEIRDHLQQLAARRKEQRFGPTGTAKAIAMADTISPVKPDAVQGRQVKNATTKTVPSVKPQLANSIADSKTVPAKKANSVVATATLDADAPPRIELTSGEGQSWRKSRQPAITGDDILTALEHPDSHVDMLLNGMANGDTAETKALAATLLGDCDPANTKVRDALAQHQKSESESDVLIAICDSQIERGEASGQTVGCLLGLCTVISSDIQIQAASQLRNFVGTTEESSCRSALGDLLGSAEANVRATAAATLGDFTSLEDSIITRLSELANGDASPNVREAAQSALVRHKPDTVQVIPTLSLNSER